MPSGLTFSGLTSFKIRDLVTAAPDLSPCVRCEDNSTVRKSLDFVMRGGDPRDLAPKARLGSQFIEQNARTFDAFAVQADLQYDGRHLALELRTGDTIGAMPLKSPVTGRFDFGMVIEPRFQWQGLGWMLGSMGWRIIPELVNLAQLPRSARHIPAWVLAAVVLQRMEHLLDVLERRFEMVEDSLQAPKGQINWAAYATERLPRMQCLSVPCRFPDLRDDRDLKAAVHFVLRQQLSSLEGQRAAGNVVMRLIAYCEQLLGRVRCVPAREPSPLMLSAWMRGPLKQPAFFAGIEAMEWVVDERGLAGLSDLRGLPWRMSMPEFFESWVETIAGRVVRQTGGVLRVGRKNETVVPISWDKSFRGSQKSLRPDLVIERSEGTIVIDAKFKRHWYELTTGHWTNLDQDIRAAHREDVLQVLAYSTLFSSPQITACLAYPCWPNTWEELAGRGELHQHATVYAGERAIDLILTAVPMGGHVDRIASTLAAALTGTYAAGERTADFEAVV